MKAKNECAYCHIASAKGGEVVAGLAVGRRAKTSPMHRGKTLMVTPCDTREHKPPMTLPTDHNRLSSLTYTSFISGLSNRRWWRNITPMLSLKQALSAPFPSAIFLTSLAVVAHAGPVDCELNKVALARVVTKEARLNFIAGPNKRTPACPSAESACRLKAYLVPGDEVLVDATDGAYVCTFFKSQGGTETRGWLPRAALQIAPPEPAPARQWDGKWQRDREAQIVIKSHQDEVEVSGNAMWGSYDPQRVKSGGIHVGELNGKGRPRGQTLAIGYDPDRSGFPPGKDQAPDNCAAKLELYGRYLMVEDNGGCGGLNVSFTGIYVRVKFLKRLGSTHLAGPEYRSDIGYATKTTHVTRTPGW